MIARRLPLGVRPAFFALAWPLIGFGLALGLNLDWDLSLFTGTVLLQIAARDALLPDSAAGFGFLVMATVGLALLAWSFTARAGPFVFYPLAAFLGLFVAVFGTTYLFDLTVSAEQTAVGGVAFVFFDYANLLHRPFQSAFGLLVLVVGLVILGRASFGRRRAARQAATGEAEFLPAPAPDGIVPPRSATNVPGVAQNRAAGARTTASARPRG